jgi:hypothetical protein
LSRKLYIHVGPRKTATSAIQRLLSAHDNSAVIYPKTAVGGEGNYHGHHGLVFTYFKDKKRSLSENMESLFANVADEAGKGNKNIILSSEILESKDVGAFVNALLPYFAQQIDVEILFTCREHFSRAASLYNFRLRTRGSSERRDPDQFLREYGNKICYEPMARNLRAKGFAVTALNYHPSDTWVRRFLTHIGFPEDKIPEIKNALVSQSPKLVIASLAVRKIVRSEGAQLDIMKRFKHMPGQRAPSGFIFSPDTARAVDKIFAIDREFIRREFGVHLVPPDLSAVTNELSLDETDFDEIVAAAERLPRDEQRAIIEFIRQYVH